MLKNWAKMKCLFLIITFASVFLKATEAEITIEMADDQEKVWMLNERKYIKCQNNKISNEEAEKIEWISPKGEKVMNRALRRVYTKTMKSSAVGNGLQLIFSRTSIGDNGVWQCRSSNLIQNVTVCVIDPTKFVQHSEETVTANVGSSIKLRCLANFGDPEPKLQWYRNGMIVTDNNNTKYKILTILTSTGIEGQLTVVSIEAEDAGIYICQTIQEISDKCVLNLFMNITLKVQHPSLFDEVSPSNLDESIHLECTPKNLILDKIWLWDDDDENEEDDSDDDKKLQDFDKGIIIFQATKENIGSRLIYMAKDETLVDSFNTYEFMKIAQFDELFDNKPGISMYVIFPDVVNSKIKGFRVQYLKENSISERKTLSKLDWGIASGITISGNDTSSSMICNDDEYIVIKITGLLEGTKYWIRIRTSHKSHLIAETEKDQNSTATPSHDAEPSNFSSGAGDFINIDISKIVFIGFGVAAFLLIFTFTASMTYCVVKRKRNKNNTLSLSESRPVL